MRALLFLLAPLTSALACGQSTVGGLGSEPVGPGTNVPPVSPPPTPDPDPVMPPVTREVLVDLRDPVLAVDSEGQLHVAGVDPDTGWPAFAVDGARVAFPGGSDLPAVQLSMVAGPDGMLHAAWTTGRTLYYGRVRPELSRRTAVVEVYQGRNLRPRLAVSDRGAVFLATVTGNTREANMRVEAFRGTVEQGFSGPERVMPDCCMTRSGEAQLLNLGTVRFDRGFVQLAYTLSDGGSARTVLVNEGRTWFVQARIPDVAQLDAGNLVLAESNEGLLTVDPTYTQLRYHGVFGSRTTRLDIHRLERVGGAHALRDRAGVVHVMVQGWDGEAQVVDYLRLENGQVTAERLVTGGPGESVGLPQGSGAFVLTDTGPIVPVTRRNGDLYVTELVGPPQGE